jgi:hypothetical protein
MPLDARYYTRAVITSRRHAIATTAIDIIAITLPLRRHTPRLHARYFAALLRATPPPFHTYGSRLHVITFSCHYAAAIITYYGMIVSLPVTPPTPVAFHDATPRRRALLVSHDFTPSRLLCHYGAGYYAAQPLRRRLPCHHLPVTISRSSRFEPIESPNTSPPAIYFNYCRDAAGDADMRHYALT